MHESSNAGKNRVLKLSKPSSDNQRPYEFRNNGYIGLFGPFIDACSLTEDVEKCVDETQKENKRKR
jgi:hypothetical protein